MWRQRKDWLKIRYVWLCVISGRTCVLMESNQGISFDEPEVNFDGGIARKWCRGWCPITWTLKSMVTLPYSRFLCLGCLLEFLRTPTTTPPAPDFFLCSFVFLPFNIFPRLQVSNQSSAFCTSSIELRRLISRNLNLWPVSGFYHI